MSPPVQLCVTSHQEGMKVFSEIGDLDNVDRNKHQKATCLAKSVALDNDAVATEHEDSSHNEAIFEAVQEDSEKNCTAQTIECQKGVCTEELVDLTSVTHTPSCLSGNPSNCTVDHDPYSYDHTSPSELFPSGLVLNDDFPQKNPKRFNRQSSKKRKKTKGASKRHFKRRRMSTSQFAPSIGGETGYYFKTVGNGTQGNKNGSTANVNGSCSPTTKTAGLNRAAICNHGNRCGGGGGGGGGDGDGNNPYRGTKIPCGCSSIVLQPKEKKEKSFSGEMEVDGKESFKGSPMDISPGSGSGTDTKMNTVDRHVAGAEEKSRRPERKPPNSTEKPQGPEVKPPSQTFLICWNSRFNHFAVCKATNCRLCVLVNNCLIHYLKQGKDGCTCDNCMVYIPAILEYHKNSCKLNGCGTCQRVKSEACTKAPRNEPRAPVVPANQQTVLDIPTSGTSLDHDEEEKAIYQDDEFKGVTHFKEHEHYTFKQHNMVGKGGNGEVYDAVVHPQIKNKFSAFADQDIVIKKAIVKEDERALFASIATHPNFVRTHFVLKKTDGNFTHRIVMEKCDTSLKAYLSKKAKAGEQIKIDECMYYWKQVLDAVAHLHNLRNPVIHKDIKAANVLLTFTTNLVRAKLADFDAVKILHNEFTQPGLVPRGTQGFIAPEVMGMDVHGRPADIYSMGMFLLEILYGKMMNDPKECITQLKNVDQQLGILIERCLKSDQSERPTAVELRDSHAVQKYMNKDFHIPY